MKIQHSAHSDEPIRKQAAAALVLVYDDVPFELLINSLLIFGQTDHFQLSRTKILILDGSPAILTSDDFIRSNEVFRTKWPIY